MDEKQFMEELLSVLEQARDRVLEIAGGIRFTKEDPQQLYLVCLLGTAVEYSQAILNAARDERSAVSLPLLARTLLEAHVDLTILAKDNFHWKNMLWSFLSQQRRALRAAPGGNPYLSIIAASVDYGPKLAEVESSLKDLQDDGYGEMTIKKKFKTAGLQDEYEAIYWSLCQESHNNLGALEDRHVEHDATTFRVVFFQGPSLARRSRFLHLAVSLLLKSSKKVFGLLDTSEIDPSLDACESRLDSISKQGLQLA